GQTVQKTLAGTTSSTASITKVELRAIRTDTNAILWSDTEVGTNMVRTTTTVAVRFFDEVLSQWKQSREIGDKRLLLRLTDESGKLKVADLKEFKEVLFGIDGVEEVVQKSLDKKEALLDILFTKERPILERSISGAPVHDKRIALKGISGGIIMVVLES